MVIYDFDFVDVFAFPTKAEAPLVVDANAVLTSYKLWKYNAVLSQRFVAVVRDFSAAASASFHPADFPLPSVRPPCDSMSSGAFPCLLSMASGTTRVAFVIRRASSRAYNCARTVSVANPAVPMPQARRQLGEPLLLARRFVFARHGARSCR